LCRVKVTCRTQSGAGLMAPQGLTDEATIPA
jgi:hypothetical protein